MKMPEMSEMSELSGLSGVVEQITERTESGVPAADRLKVEPFLHFGADRIYNNLTDRFLSSGEPGFGELHRLRHGLLSLGELSSDLRGKLFAGGWLVESAPGLSARFRLKYVSLEASTVCNQA